MLSLLLIVLCVRILAATNGGLVNLYTRMAVLDCHATFRGGCFAVRSELGLGVGSNGEGAVTDERRSSVEQEAGEKRLPIHLAVDGHVLFCRFFAAPFLKVHQVVVR